MRQGQTAPKKGAPKKPVAASAAHDLCNVQRTLFQEMHRREIRQRPGFREVVSLGPTGAEEFKTSEAAEAESARLVEIANRTGKRPW